MQGTTENGPGAQNGTGNRTLAQRAEQYAEWAYDMLARRVSTPKVEDRRELLAAARVQARVAETLAMRDMADSNRELARSNTRLALSYDAMVDEMRARRGVPEQAQ